MTEDHSNTVLASAEATLFVWSVVDGHGAFQGEGESLTAQIVQRDGEYRFWLTGVKSGQTILMHDIKSNMNEKWSPKMISLTWNQVDHNDTDMTSWVYRFNTEEDYSRFLETFTAAAWQTKFQAPWSKVKVRTCQS